MRIIRFRDESGRIRFGHDHRDGQALILEGGLAEGFTETGRRAAVEKILAPVQAAVILGIGLNYHEHARETGLDVPK